MNSFMKLPELHAQPRYPSRRLDGWLTNVFLVSSALIINPVIVAFVAAYFESVKKIRLTLFFFFFMLYIFMGFWLREYGINFSALAGDDVPEYFRRINLIQFQTITGIFSTFIARPSVGEPVFYLINLPISGLSPSIEFFAFYNYTVFAILFSIALRINLQQFSILASLVLFFFVAEVSYAFIHLWRQALATVFVFYAFYFIKYNKHWHILFFLSLAALSHLVAALILIFYLVKNVPRILTKKSFSHNLVFILITASLVFSFSHLMTLLGKSYDIEAAIGTKDGLKLLIVGIGSSLIHWVLFIYKKNNNQIRFIYFIVMSMVIIGLVSGPLVAHRIFAFIVSFFLLYVVLALSRVLRPFWLYLMLSCLSILLLVRLMLFSQGAFHAAYYYNFFSFFNSFNLTILGG